MTNNPSQDVRSRQERQIDALLEQAARIKRDLTLSKNVRNAGLTDVWAKIATLQNA